MPADSIGGERPVFGSAWGVVLTTAGAAIGLGNIWRFPYMMGEYGGSAFLVLYLLLVVAFGVPALMAECALGRHTRRGPVGAFHRAGMPGATVWSGLLLLTIVMAGSYYGVVLADVLRQGVRFGVAAFGGTVPEGDARFAVSMVWVLVTICVTCVTIGWGLRRGIERVSVIGLPLFFVMLIVLIVYVLRQDGAMEGLRQFLRPSVGDLQPSTALAALGQAVFSLGLGGTLMVIYGSYMRDQHSIPRTAIGTAAADVGAALLAGMLIVPAVFVVGVQLDSGPDLLFKTLPAVFHGMPGGNVVGATFFLGVFLVGVLSLVAAYEVVVGAAKDTLGWSRAKAVVVFGLVQLVLSIPVVLSDDYLRWSDLIWGTTMMPVGSALAVVAMAWFVGRARLIEELGRGSQMPVTPLLVVWLKFVVPLGIAVILVYGWWGALRG